MSLDNTPSADAWGSNATLPEIVDRLRLAKRITVLTHAKPDGDAVGSAVGLTRALAHVMIPATPVFLGAWLSRFDPLIAPTRIVHEHHKCFAEPEIAEADTVVIVDTGSWTQVADARAYIEPRREQTIVIDHHSHGDPEIGAMRHVDPSAAAAAELIAVIAMGLIGVETPARLPKDVAEVLYLGIATDTGWFKYPNTTSRTMRLAADFMDAGVDADRLYQLSEQGDSPARLRLIERALASLKFVDGDRGAVMSLSKADFEATGASEDEYGGIIDLPKSIGSVRVIALLTELEPGVVKVSFRSKAALDGAQEIDVNLVAQLFGGGGHKHAAGAKIHQPLERAVDAVTRAIASA